jgi:hypothetical protein
MGTSGVLVEVALCEGAAWHWEVPDWANRDCCIFMTPSATRFASIAMRR